MIDLALACFAVFRVAELLTVDDGPWDIFMRLRILAGVYDLCQNGQPKTNLGRLFLCPYCLGVWLAFPAALIVSPFDWHLILYWFAISGVQAFLQTIGGRK